MSIAAIFIWRFLQARWSGVRYFYEEDGMKERHQESKRGGDSIRKWVKETEVTRNESDKKSDPVNTIDQPRIHLE
jgi:hypothetical protein